MNEQSGDVIESEMSELFHDWLVSQDDDRAGRGD